MPWKRDCVSESILESAFSRNKKEEQKMNFSDEPALWISGVGAIVGVTVNLLIAFGVPIDSGQKEALAAFATVVVTVATGLVIRTQVTPTSNIPVPAPPAPVPPAPAPPATKS
jgi:uncharacterized membrane protein